MSWKIEAILPALVSIIPTQRLIVYLAEEALVVLVVIAAMLIIVLLFAVGFVLFSTGARSGFFWLRAKFARPAGSYGHFGHREAVANPSPRRG
jgi:hypothetical protein